MAKFQSPLLGYNNNVRYRGRVFHIQTEDSGVNHPHVITHLFMDGGRILKSVKRSYAEHVGSDGMSETVRVMMKEQHKAMFVALREGQFDELLEAPKKPSATATKAVLAPTDTAAPRGEAPQAAASKASPENATGAMAERSASADARNAAPEASGAATAKAAPPKTAGNAPASKLAAQTAPNDAPRAPKVSVETGSSPRLPAAAHTPRRDEPLTSTRTSISDVDSTLPLEIAALLREDIEPEPTTTREPERAPSAHELTLDFDALEPSHGSAYGSRQDAPPRQPEESRFAPTRPGALFGATGRTSSASMFNDELASDKSLDEIILSYLAEDLDPTSQK